MNNELPLSPILLAGIYPSSLRNSLMAAICCPLYPCYMFVPGHYDEPYSASIVEVFEFNRKVSSIISNGGTLAFFTQTVL